MFSFFENIKKPSQILCGSVVLSLLGEGLLDLFSALLKAPNPFPRKIHIDSVLRKALNVSQTSSVTLDPKHFS